MVGMSQEQSALFGQSLTWKFVLRTGLVKESICHTSPSLLQTFGETCRSVGASAYRRLRHTRWETCLRRATPVARERKPTTPHARKRVTHMQRSPNAERRTPNADT